MMQSAKRLRTKQRLTDGEEAKHMCWMIETNQGTTVALAASFDFGGQGHAQHAFERNLLI
jgi:hypothetical protein